MSRDKYKNIFIDTLSSKLEVDLINDLLLKKREIFNLRFKRTTGELKDSSVFKKIRKDISRINTEIALRKKTKNK